MDKGSKDDLDDNLEIMDEEDSVIVDGGIIILFIYDGSIVDKLEISELDKFIISKQCSEVDDNSTIVDKLTNECTLFGYIEANSGEKLYINLPDEPRCLGTISDIKLEERFEDFRYNYPETVTKLQALNVDHKTTYIIEQM